jgi:hypothetical protein
MDHNFDIVLMQGQPEVMDKIAKIEKHRIYPKKHLL